MAKSLIRVSLYMGTPDEKLAALSDARPYLEYDATARRAVSVAREQSSGRTSTLFASICIGQPQAPIPPAAVS